MSHTPGPWSNPARAEQKTIPLKAVFCERLGYAIGFVNGHSEEEAQANAHLIAAAPDLLRELRRAREVIAVNFPQWGRDVKPLLAPIDAAIAKAEGKS